MKRFTATLYRSCNALVIVVLLLGSLPSAQNLSSPTFEPPVAHAQEGAAIPLEEVMAPPDEPASSLNGASGGLLATKMAKPSAVSPADLVTYTIVLTNTTKAAMEGLVVSDPLPDGLAYLPGSADDGVYDPDTRTLTWDVRELAAGASLSVAFQARVRDDALDELVVNLAEVTGRGLADPVQAKATVAVVSQAVITPQEGGVLVSPSGRVRVEFPAGAVTQPVEATYRSLDVRRLPPGQTGLALQCELTARPANAEASDLPITRFQEPLRLTVDLTELVDEAALGEYLQPFVGYLDEATDRWVHLPLVDQQEGPVLTVEVEHFSILGGGLDGSTGNQGWKLLYNEPQVALFSGAAVYDHPIEVPAGRNGLQPALNLSYNSRRVDGITGWVESDWAGMGWSMDLMDIVREGLECHTHDQTVFIHYENRFSLLMNGTSYELEPDPGVGAGQPGRYHAKDASSLYVILEDDAPYPEAGGNVTGLYWIVKTPDGTSYRLGYTTNSEQVLWPTPNGEGWYNGGVKDSGREKNYTTFRWRLDEAVDVYSNTMQVTYREAQGGHLEKRDTASVLHEVKYNSMGGGQWAAKVVFNPNGPNFGPQPDYNDRRILGSQGQLDRIEVWHGGQLVRVHYYDLGYDNTTTPANTTIRRLISIQQFSGDGQQSLPAATLEYEDKWNKGKCNPADPACDTDWEREAFPYPRLVQVNNGYGGTAKFDYVSDGRSSYWTFYNYRVSQRRIYDGVDAAPARTTTYAYGTMCYDQNGDPPDYMPEGAEKCRGRSPSGIGPLVGHDWVTETLYSDGAPLVETTHHFYIDDNHSWRLGREHQTQIYPGQGELLRQTDTTWGSTAICNTTFAHVDRVVTTDYDEGETFSTRVDYDYDDYGNTTEVREYDESDALYRRTLKQYVYNPDTTVWIVNCVSRQRLFDNGGVEKARTDYYYDRDAQGNLRAHGSTPTKGALVAVKAMGLGTAADSLTQFWYDSYGNQTQTRDPNGYDTETTYDGTLHTLPTQQTNAASHVTEWYYYGVNGTTPVPAGGFFGKLERERDPNDADTRYHYDAFGRLTKVIRPGDTVDLPTTRYEYRDSYPWLDVPNGGFETGDYWFEYDPSGIQTYQYDASQFHSGSRSLKIVTSSTADHWVGNNSITGWQAGRTYWLSAYVKTTSSGQFCLNLAAKAGHEASVGCVTATANWQIVQGAVTLPADATQFLILLRTPQVGTVYVDDVQVGSLLEVGVYDKEDAAGNTRWSRQVYDGLGRLVQEQAEKDGNQAIIVHRQYDARGSLARQSLPVEVTSAPSGNKYVPPLGSEVWTSYSYDALGRVVVVTAPDGTQTNHYYGLDTDVNVGIPTLTGLPVHSIKDANGHAKHYVEDAFGRLVIVRDFNGTCYPGPGCSDPYTFYAAIYYAYNVLDNLTTVTDTLDNVTTMAYDALGRKTGMADPDMGAWSYDYDAVGNLTRQTDARNQTVCFYYDVLNRLTGKHYRADTDCPTPAPPSYDVSYSYDSIVDGNKGKGRRTGMSDGSGSASWVYDARGRLTKEQKDITGEGTFVTQWSYRPDDQVWTMTYPADNAGNPGETVTTTYDPMGLVESVVGDYTYVGNTTYNALGQVTERRLGSVSGVLRQLYTYTAAENFRLTALSSGTSPNYNDRQNITYTYDDVGNVQSITDAAAVGGSQTQDFTYDFLDRLLSAEVTDGSNGRYSESYEYSGNGGKIGNRTFKTGVGGSGNYLYDAPVNGCSAGTPSTKPHAVRQAGSYTFTYDCNGNLVQRNVGSSYTLTYDAENHLTSVSGGASASFVYDGDGNRVKATLGVSTTVYVGSYYEQMGDVIRKYYYANGQRVAMREGATLYYLLTDHLGSTAITADSSGAREAELRYKAWGENRYTDGTTPTAYKFTGQRLDDSTGLYYYGARYYDAALGRFVQADTIVPEPANPQALNRYTYTYNNPLKYTDPSGYIAENEYEEAMRIIMLLQGEYGVSILVDFGWRPIPHPSPGEPGQVWIEGAWELSEMGTVLQAVGDLAGAMGGAERFRENLGGVRIARREMRHAGLARAHRVWLNAAGFSQWTVVHELGHAWDAAKGWRLSREMQRAMGAGFAHPVRHFFDRDNPDYWYDPGQGPPPCGVDANFNRKEDFAEAVTAYVYSDEAQRRASSRGWPYHDPQRGYHYAHFHDTPRGQYIGALMVARP